MKTARIMVIGSAPFAVAVAWIFGADGKSFVFGLIAYLAICATVYAAVRSKPSRDELLAMWDEGTPAVIVSGAVETGADYARHSSLCARNATGHRGCTCGAEPGRRSRYEAVFR